MSWFCQVSIGFCLSALISPKKVETRQMCQARCDSKSPSLPCRNSTLLLVTITRIGYVIYFTLCYKRKSGPHIPNIHPKKPLVMICMYVYIYMWRSHVSRESLLDFRLDAQTTSLASTGSTRTDPTSLAVETGHPGLEGELHRDVLPIVWTK